VPGDRVHSSLSAGAYKLGAFPTKIGNINLTFRERPFNWYLQLQYEYPFMTIGNYTPGKEFASAFGIYYFDNQDRRLYEPSEFKSLNRTIGEFSSGGYRVGDPSAHSEHYSSVLSAPIRGMLTRRIHGLWASERHRP
jgi:hypothetical protein